MVDQAYQIKERLEKLEQTLIDNSPGMAEILRDIYKSLKADPDVVTILTEEECSILVRGLKKQTATEIAVKAIKKGSTKSLKKMTLADL